MTTKFDFDDIYDAFDFVSTSYAYENTAFLDMDTGKIYYKSDVTDIDELPENIDYGNYIEIPHRNELDLGRTLIYDFARKHLPEEIETIESIFNTNGAYSRFKSLLDSRGLLEQWYEFELEQQQAELRKWCEKNSIELKD